MTIKFKKNLFAVILLIISASLLYSEPLNLSGKVINRTGKPLADVRVRLAKYPEINTKTDTSGAFTLTGEITEVRHTIICGIPQKAIFSGSELTIVSKEKSKASISIYTVSGKTVYQKNTSSLKNGLNIIALPMNSFSTGVYLISVAHEGNRYLFRYGLSTRYEADINTPASAAYTSAELIPETVIDTLLFSAENYLDTAIQLFSYTKSDIAITMERASRLANITRKCSDLKPPALSGGQSGWGSRYWDCCKPHCSWPEKTNRYAANCSKDGVEIECFKKVGNEHWSGLEGTKSGCDPDGIAYMCYSHVPYAVCEELAYGFAAVPANTDICGKCYQIDFDGGFKHGNPKPAHKLMKGKTMIVMASNIGHDVGGGQFDLMIPGGGLGAFKSGCQKQWGIDVNNEALVGKAFGGFTSTCQEKLGWDAAPDDVKECVRSMCDNLFGKNPALRDLYEGCIWYVDWMHAVDNPTFTYKEVECPKALIDIYYSSFHPKP